MSEGAGVERLGVADHCYESSVEPLDDARVSFALWTHLDDHPFEQLDVVALAEDARLDETMVVGDAEQAGPNGLGGTTHRIRLAQAADEFGSLGGRVIA